MKGFSCFRKIYCSRQYFSMKMRKKSRISCASFWHKWTTSQFIKFLRKKLFPVYEYLSTLQDFHEKIASVTGLKMWKSVDESSNIVSLGCCINSSTGDSERQLKMVVGCRFEVYNVNLKCKINLWRFNLNTWKQTISSSTLLLDFMPLNGAAICVYRLYKLYRLYSYKLVRAVRGWVAIVESRTKFSKQKVKKKAYLYEVDKKTEILLLSEILVR